VFRWTYIVITAVLVACLAGCDLFSTRDPETPDSGRNTWKTPVEPIDVLTNMQAALFERDAVNYMRSFDDSTFHFEADPVALSRDQSLADWGYDEESQHIARLFSEGTLPAESLLSVVFIAPEIVPVGTGWQILTRYEFVADIALTGVPHQMAGTADFSIHVGGAGYLQIDYWRDLRTEDAATWSDFKSLVR
jgi:hypothetical protein